MKYTLSFDLNLLDSETSIKIANSIANRIIEFKNRYPDCIEESVFNDLLQHKNDLPKLLDTIQEYQYEDTFGTDVWYNLF
jgi:hypothetical protein